MKIVIAPDSFKGSLSARKVGEAIGKGISAVDKGIKTVIVPMADGGEGTVQSLMDVSDGKFVELMVHDPLCRKIKASYGIMGDGKTAVIEMAAGSGLTLLKSEERNPLKTTTYGFGELIKDALDKGCTKIILGLGGSATNDGGIGMAKALGVRFLDKGGMEVGFGGLELLKIHSINTRNIDKRIQNIEFVAACDVDNPLCGINGASRVYGKQKGASKSDMEILDRGLAHLAKIVKNNLDLDKNDFPGAGAAGGLGYGVMVFLNAKLERGIDIVIRSTGLDEKMNGADLVITGEGKIDSQTVFGKTPFGVAQVAKQKGLPVIAVAGSLDKGYKKLYDNGFDGIFSIIDKPMILNEAIENTTELLENTSEAILRLWIAEKNN